MSKPNQDVEDLVALARQFERVPAVRGIEYDEAFAWLRKAEDRVRSRLARAERIEELAWEIVSGRQKLWERYLGLESPTIAVPTDLVRQLDAVLKEEP